MLGLAYQRFVEKLGELKQAINLEQTASEIAGKEVSNFGSITQNFAIGIKLVLEYGAKNASRVIRIIETNTSLLQERQSVIQVVQNLGSACK